MPEITIDPLFKFPAKAALDTAPARRFSPDIPAGRGRFGIAHLRVGDARGRRDDGAPYTHPGRGDTRGRVRGHDEYVSCEREAIEGLMRSRGFAASAWTGNRLFTTGQRRDRSPTRPGHLVRPLSLKLPKMAKGGTGMEAPRESIASAITVYTDGSFECVKKRCH